MAPKILPCEQLLKPGRRPHAVQRGHDGYRSIRKLLDSALVFLLGDQRHHGSHQLRWPTACPLDNYVKLYQPLDKTIWKRPQLGNAPPFRSGGRVDAAGRARK